MNKQYCVQCGAPNAYESNPPNFCCGCGKPFNKSVAKVYSDNSIEEEDEPTEEGSIPVDKQSLAQDWVVKHDSYHQPTIGDIFGSNAGKNVNRGPRPSPLANVDPKEVVNSVRSECAKVTESKSVGR